jgi:hypothetical protein
LIICATRREESLLVRYRAESRQPALSPPN